MTSPAHSTPSTTLSTSSTPSPPSPVTVAGLLEEHQNDHLAALTSLVARTNKLAIEHAQLQLAKEAAEKAAARSALENQQLWRSLRANVAGPKAAGGTSAPRQNSEGMALSKETLKGILTGERSAVGSPSNRRNASNSGGPSTDTPTPHVLRPSRSHNDTSLHQPLFSSPPPLQTPLPPAVALPDPPRSLQRAISHSSLRKAASVDLGRGIENGSNINEIFDSRPELQQKELQQVQEYSVPSGSGEIEGRITSSVSMPAFATTRQTETMPETQRLYLPDIPSLSPLHLQTPPDNSSLPPSPHEGPSERQLQPPRPLDPDRRSPSPTNNSISSVGSLIIETSYSEPPKSPARSTPTSPFVPGMNFDSNDPRSRNNLGSRRPSQDVGSGRRPSQDHSSSQTHLPIPSQLRENDSIAHSTDPHLSQYPLPPVNLPPPLASNSLPVSNVRVVGSNIKINEKGKEIVSFVVDVTATYASNQPEHAGRKVNWRIEKKYSEVLELDSAVKGKNSKQESKSINSLPDKSLLKDHAPSKSDQRKNLLERYLQTLISIPLKDRAAIYNFFNTNIVPESSVNLNHSGHMEGWLTKRGRNFGGWQTRYYVLSPGTLAYYATREGYRDGVKLGEINITAASIGRQSSSRATEPADDTYLHAFLIRTPKKDDKEQDDHILCAENDEARDAWVIALTSMQNMKRRPNGSSSMDRERIPAPSNNGGSTSLDAGRHRRQYSFGSFTSPIVDAVNPLRRVSPGSSDVSTSASVPMSLDSMAARPPPIGEPGARSTSELGQYPPMPKAGQNQEPRTIKTSTHSERPSTPQKEVPANKIIASNVSGPMNAAPLPTGYDFKKSDRTKKTKSFWNFSSRGASSTGANEKGSSSGTHSHPPAPSRPVFGVPLKEAVALSRIRPGLELPAVVYRCVEYLENKNAECEEGIFRLSGSANVIRMLKDRFNAEGDVNLLREDQFYDTHAIAGLLKTFLRELPVHILTRELHSEFIQVIDLRNRKDRVNALGKLVAQLPIEEYTLFRFFFAHLCAVAQNAEVSKMGVRNLGIVFSPTLAIPAPLFSLLLTEFDLVFAVDGETGLSQPVTVEDDEASSLVENESRRKSRASRTPRPRPNSEIYLSSGAAVLEGDPTQRLRRQVEEEESATSDSTADDPPGADIDEDGNTSPIYTTTSNIGGHRAGQPGSSPRKIPVSPLNLQTPTPTAQNFPSGDPRARSPGLPVSPRPGASFISPSLLE